MLLAILALAVGPSAPNVIDSLHVAGNVEVTVKRGETLNVQADDRLVVTYEATTVRIENRPGDKNPKPAAATVTFPVLKKIELSGAVRALLDDVRTDRLVAALAGSSKLEASGTVDSFGVTANGAAVVKARGLKSADTTVALAGAGSAEVYAGRTLTASAAGAGAIHFWGGPADVTRNVTGAATIIAH